MNGSIFMKGARIIRGALLKRSEFIGASVATAAFGICLYETVKELPEIQRIIEDKKKDYESCAPDDIEAKNQVIFEAVKEVAPHAAKPLAAGALCVTAQWVGPIISKNKQAALAAGFSMLEETMRNTDKHMEEIVGKKKADQVREAVAQDHVENYQGGGIIETGHGNQLFFMMSTGAWFRSSPDYIRLVFSRINERLADYEEIDFNDALDDIGLERCSLGDLVGWSARDGERAEADLRNTGMYVDRVTGKEEAAIFVSTNEQPLRNVFGDLDWHRHY